MLGCKGCCTPFTGGQTRNSSTGSMRHSPLSDFSAETRPVLIAFMSVWRVTPRSEEHTSELKSPMRSSYAVFCLKKKKERKTTSRKQNQQAEIRMTYSVQKNNQNKTKRH